MNYRHIFHAGNPCDVVKHASLCLLIDALRAKPKPFAVLDTHAGVGLYDLSDPRALQTHEADAGIKRLVAAKLTPPPEIMPYLDRVRAANEGQEGLRFYPGSPLLIRGLLRDHDRLMACELHPDDSKLLRYQFHADKQVQIHHRDGYLTLKSLLPPPERRGLVLIDPPFEKTDEFDRLVEALALLHHRWRDGHIAVWYPIKDRPAIWQFHESLRGLEIPGLLLAEFMFYPENRTDRLNGTGLLLMNPPWKIEAKLAPLYAYLHEALQTETHATQISWLTDPL